MINRIGESKDRRANGGVGDKNLKNTMVVKLDKIATFQVDNGPVEIGDQRGDHASDIDADVVANDTMKLDIVSVKFQLRVT